MDLKTVSDLSNYFHKEGAVTYSIKFFQRKDVSGSCFFHKELIVTREEHNSKKVLYKENKEIERPTHFLEDIVVCVGIETNNRESCLTDSFVPIDIINNLSTVIKEKVKESLNDLKIQSKGIILASQDNDMVIKVELKTPHLESECRIDGLLLSKKH